MFLLSYRSLIGGDSHPLTRVLELFYSQMSIHGVMDLNKEELRSILEMFWFERRPLSELRLVIDPKGQSQEQRYRFVDVFLSSSAPKPQTIHSPSQLRNATILELKIVTLRGLLQALDSDQYPMHERLQSLREVISKESETQLLARKFCQWDIDSNCWSKPVPIALLKEGAIQEVRSYVETLANGCATEMRAGMLDEQICCENGETSLKGYVVICIGGVKVWDYQVCTCSTQYVFCQQA
jgi:hypothetical protein